MRGPTAVRRITGPVSAYKVRLGERIFYMFGDVHGSFMNGCTEPATHLIEEIVNIINRYPDSDVFIEAHYQDPDARRISYARGWDVLTNVIKYFSRCFRSTGTCKYPARFHYVDIRNVDIRGKDQSFSLSSILSYLDDYLRDILTEEPVDKAKFGRLLRVLTPYRVRLFELALDSDNYLADVFDLLGADLYLELAKDTHLFKIISRSGTGTQHRARKQLVQLAKEGQRSLANFIRDYMVETFRAAEKDNDLLSAWLAYESIEGQMSMQTRKILNISDPQERVRQLAATKAEYTDKLEVALDRLKQARQYSIYNQTFEMDAYLLARLFRNFSKTGRAKIIVAGEIHIQTYRTFFEFLGASIEAYTPTPVTLATLTADFPDKVSRCIVVPEDF